MPQYIEVSEATSLLAITQDAMRPFSESDFVSVLPRFPITNSWFATKRRRVMAGPFVEHPITLSTGGSTTLTKIGERIPVGQAEKRRRIKVGWCYSNFHIVFEDREILINRQPAQLRDLYRERKRDEYIGFAEKLEYWGMGTPEDPNDDRTPFGARSWIVRANPGAPLGFSFGGIRTYFQDGSFITNIGGIDRATEPMARNPTYVYQGAIDNGFIDGPMSEVMISTGLRAPTMAPGATDYNMDNVTINVGKAIYLKFKRMARKQMADGGADLETVKGELRFSGMPIIYQPSMDALQHGDILWIDHSRFRPVTLADEWLNEHSPMDGGVELHRTKVIHVDCAWNTICTNFRYSGCSMHTPIAG